MSLFLQRGVRVGVRGFLTLLTGTAAGPPAALTEPDCASEDAEEARTYAFSQHSFIPARSDLIRPTDRPSLLHVSIVRLKTRHHVHVPQVSNTKPL